MMWVVCYKSLLLGPYKSQGAATAAANRLKNGAYTKPLLTWKTSFAERYFAGVER